MFIPLLPLFEFSNPPVDRPITPSESRGGLYVAYFYMIGIAIYAILSIMFMTGHFYPFMRYCKSIYLDHALITLLLTPVLGFFSIIGVTQVFWIRRFALWALTLTFIQTLILTYNFNFMSSDFQFSWTVSLDFIKLFFGIDGISLLFLLFINFLLPICLLVGWNLPWTKSYCLLMLLLDFLFIGVFIVTDLFSFFFFFESTLLPMFIIILVWGSRLEKIKAAYWYLLYTFAGSILMLLGILWIYTTKGVYDLISLYSTPFSVFEERYLWLCFFFSFAIKTPLVPFHIWLPQAHVEAPTAGSILLAGILLKLGGYGFLRILLPLFPTATQFYKPLIYTLCVLGIIYTSIVTFIQVDLKKIIAYSSIGHMSLSTLGLFSNNIHGMYGSIYLMIAHGIVSGALFLLVGLLYDRTHTRYLKYLGGVGLLMPFFSVSFFFFTLANMGVPLFGNFVGELLIFQGVFSDQFVIGMLSATGIFLSGSYSIWLFNRLVFGNLKLKYLYNVFDLLRLELVLVILLLIVSFVQGILLPPFFSDMLYNPLEKLQTIMQVTDSDVFV